MDEFNFLYSGLVLGLSAGFSPGPLLTLVISETLKYSIKEGVKVAVSPMITDIPIILGILILLSHLSQHMIGAVSILGGLFLVYLGYESLIFRGTETQLESSAPRSFQKGIAANFLNPSPYLFWGSIGAPMMIHKNIQWTIGFLLVFYICLVGSKVGIAFLTGTSRRFLKSRHYIYVIRGLGLALCGFAVIFFKKGLAVFF